MRVANIDDLIELAGNAMDPGIDTNQGDIRHWAQRNLEFGPAYTAECEGRAIAAFGVWLVRPGVGLAWIVVSRDIERSFAFMKEWLIKNRMMVEAMAETFGLRKMRAISRIGFVQSQSLLDHLGFERLRKWRKDYYIYRRSF